MNAAVPDESSQLATNGKSRPVLMVAAKFP
jgi:hypothetical protein